VPDLLTHVLIVYSACLVVSWRLDWLDRSFVTVAMVGAMMPDISKLNLLLPNWLVERWLSLPFSWTALHTAGGVALTILVTVTLVGPAYRKRVAALLAFGAGTHLLADAMLRSVTGRSFAFLWPLSTYAPPTPGLYLSTDPWPTVVAIVTAVAVTALDRYR
jgi:hypothetical protein